MGELVDELAPLVRGAEVKDVQGLPPRDLLLVLVPDVASDDVLRLRLSADPDAARIHLQHGRVHRHDGPIGPFFQNLAKELAGATLRRLEQVGGDRIVLLEFGGTPSGERRALALELFGRHANLVLLGRGEVVLDLLVGAPSKARRRGTLRLEIGSEWQPPGGTASAPDHEDPPLAAALGETQGTVRGHLAGLAPLSWRVEEVLGAVAEESFAETERRRLQQRIDRKLGRARGLVRGLEKRESASDRAERVLQDGELLKASVAAVARGAESIELDDWFTDGAPKRRITLDPRRSPQENVQRLFERYKKLERSRASVAAELERARAKVVALEQVRAESESTADPLALELRAMERGLLDPRQVADPRKKKAPAPRLPYRSFTGCRGSEIRVGRTARDNDELTFHHSRGNDLWLHTADCPGSHVILRLERGAEPDHEELLDAAHLAVHFSPAKGAGKAPVHVARRKHVQKPKGAKPGLVRLSGGKTHQVRVQPERLEGLLRSARDRTEPE